MNKAINCILLISILSISLALPHFIFDGIESNHQCSKDKETISFSIHGSFSEKLNINKFNLEDYYIEDMGHFKCSLYPNENLNNPRRTHRIECSIEGLYHQYGFILDEPKFSLFDFNIEGKSTWPEKPEKRTFLIGECGSKIEVNKKPVLMNSLSEYLHPLNRVRRSTVDKALSSLPQRNITPQSKMLKYMRTLKAKFSLSEEESAYLVFKWLSENIEYNCYDYYYNFDKLDYSEDYAYKNGKGVCNSYSLLYVTMTKALGLESYKVNGYTKEDNGEFPKMNHAWNAVKIRGLYYLVDSTWGTGGCNGGHFVKKFREYYFCTNPDLFIYTHYPAEEKWKLTSFNIDLSKFAKTIKLDGGFFNNNIKTISPDIFLTTTTINSQFVVTMTYDTSIQLIAGGYLLYRNEERYLHDDCSTEIKNGVITVLCQIKARGNYELSLYARKYTSLDADHITTYQIFCQ